MKAIDLGRESGPLSAPVGKPEKAKYYPTLYIDSAPGEIDLPTEGEMTVRFKVCSKTVSERDGEKTSSVSVEIQKIIDVEADEEDQKSERKSAEDTLDKYAEEESEKD